MRRHLISQTEHLNFSGITSHGTYWFRVKPITPGHPISRISSAWLFYGGYLKDRVCENNPHTRENITRREIKRFHKICSIELWTILMFELRLYVKLCKNNKVFFNLVLHWSYITALKASNILHVHCRSITFPGKGVNVTNKFLLAKLYQYLGNFQ